MKLPSAFTIIGLSLMLGISLHAQVKTASVPIVVAIDNVTVGQEHHFRAMFVRTKASFQVPIFPVNLSANQFLEKTASTSSKEDQCLAKYFADLEKGDADATANAYSSSGGFRVTNAKSFLAEQKEIYSGDLRIVGRIPLESGQCYLLSAPAPDGSIYSTSLTVIPENDSFKILATQNFAALELLDWSINHSLVKNPLDSLQPGTSGAVFSKACLSSFAKRIVTDTGCLDSIRAAVDRAEKTELKESFTEGSQRKIDQAYGSLAPAQRSKAVAQFIAKLRKIDCVLDFDPVFAVVTAENSSDRFVLFYRDPAKGMLIAEQGSQDPFTRFLWSLSPLLPHKAAQ